MDPQRAAEVLCPQRAAALPLLAAQRVRGSLWRALATSGCRRGGGAAWRAAGCCAAAAAARHYAAAAAEPDSLAPAAGADAVAAPRQRPESVAEAGPGPLPRDFIPGEGTQLIEPELEIAERFYRPVSPVPLEEVLAYEERRKHFSIYRDVERPESELQQWEGGIPRFIRIPMHMIVAQEDSRNPDMPLGPVLHDTRTGVAIRILGSMRPSPEQAIMEDQLRAKMWTWGGRIIQYGLFFTFACLFKFIQWMATRTKLKRQGEMNPVLPQNRIKTLEIIWYARDNFAEYKQDFNDFMRNYWLPYRVTKLKQDHAAVEMAGIELMKQSIDPPLEPAPKWWQFWKSGRPNPDEALPEKKPETVMVEVPEAGRSFEVDTSRPLVGMSPDGPVYAPPDTELLDPTHLKSKMESLRGKMVASMDEDTRLWTEKSYDDRARELANEFVVQFHTYLRNKGRITPLDPAKVDQMYELRPIPRIQHLDDFASDNQPSRAQLVH